MSAIRGRDTKPELAIRKALHQKGFRYRLHVKDLPGAPDIVLPKYRVAIFVHGCFWHGHACPLFKIPKTRTDFWLTKIQQNVNRDARDFEKLLASGWRVGIVWECRVKGPYKEDPEILIANVVEWMTAGTESSIELPEIGVNSVFRPSCEPYHE
jgi:DNA mismatch endonuclease, patch repair protein